MWDIVWVSPQGHRSVSVSRHFLLQAPQCPCSTPFITDDNTSGEMMISGDNSCGLNQVEQDAALIFAHILHMDPE